MNEKRKKERNEGPTGEDRNIESFVTSYARPAEELGQGNERESSVKRSFVVS